ncbi:Erv1/Alr family protein [Tetraselmis virus 1]|uniref:Sulfhydryl oxidase n=1 Tax=Tetraselmis virus 1 TaxID=2060617 RepID=A0A2P0VN55_9VIRU|nr:Erv1/Alr family protein [Tetraselmis virus 1]AUF82328.1 Erv1/Alr family protein [Tetraselmis virus 1]
MRRVRPITPQVWGEPMWRLMHIIAMGYPINPTPSQKKAYKDFYMSLKVVLPCIKCATGYTNIVNKHPIDDALNNPSDLFLWTVVVHNEVSKKLGKPDMTPDYVRSEYVYGDKPDQLPSWEENIANRNAVSKVNKKEYLIRVACAAAVLLFVAIVAWFVTSQ